MKASAEESFSIKTAFHKERGFLQPAGFTGVCWLCVGQHY